MDDCKSFVPIALFMMHIHACIAVKHLLPLSLIQQKQMLAVAQYYAKVGNKDKAKVMYRKVIATFVEMHIDHMY